VAYVRRDRSAHPVVAYCADIGSVAKKHFAWARGAASSRECLRGSDPRELAAAVAADLMRRTPVALGFECPLFVPVPEDPARLTARRDGEGQRPWSAAAGAASLVTGLTETVWVLRELRRLVSAGVAAFLEWEAFRASGTGLFLWEAFVTSGGKGSGHSHDAEIAVQRFLALIAELTQGNAVQQSGPVHSLVGAALLRTGWGTDLALLETPCLVIKT